MELFLFNLFLTVGRWILGWVWKLSRPILKSVFKLLWPVIKLLLIVAGLVAAILLLRQLLLRRALAAPPRKRLKSTASA